MEVNYRRIFNPTYVLISMICVSLVIRFFIISRGINTLVGKFLVDDAYYYFSLTRNIVQGSGIVFNTGVPTNGFHPLYVVIITPVFMLFSQLGSNIPVYVSLGLLSLFSAGTAVFIYLILSSLLNEKCGLLGAIFWLFNPFVLFTTLEGLETPIQVFFLGALTWVYLKTDRSELVSSLHASLIGLLIALVFLSRLDGIFIALGVYGMWATKRLTQTGIKSPHQVLYQCRDIVLSGSVATVLVLPWIIWSILVVGRLTPVSGAALRLRRLTYDSWAELTREAILNLGHFIRSYFVMIELPIVISAALLGIIFISILFSFLKLPDLAAQLLHEFDFLVIASILYYSYYIVYATALKSWYSPYTSYLLTLLVPMVIAYILQPQRSWFKSSGYVIVAVVLLSTFAMTGAITYQTGIHDQQQKFEVVKYVEEEIPKEKNIGSFNSGFYQYYIEDQDVLNLDGVMNPAAYQAREDNRLCAYISDQNIKYIIDTPRYKQNFDSCSFDASVFKSFEFETSEGQFTINIYRLQ